MQCTRCGDLFVELCQDVVELAHHLRVDGVARSNVAEVEQHLERSLGRAQRLERGVDEPPRFALDQRHVAVELLLHRQPRVAVLDVEHVERRLKNHLDPFNGPFSGTTRVGRYQKGKTNLDFTEARDGEWQWHQLGRMQVCTSLQTDNQTSTPPLCFYSPDALPAAQPTASKH